MNWFTKWWEKNKVAIIAGAMEAGRLSVLAVIPFLLDASVAWEIPLEVKAVLVVLLRFVDKYLHKKGKEDNNELLVTGITRF